MADRGNIALVMHRRPRVMADARHRGVGTTGNTISGTGATASATLELSGSFGFLQAVATADGSGNFTFYDIMPGTFYVRQRGSAKTWLLTVASDLSYTLTRVSPGTVVSVG